MAFGQHDRVTCKEDDVCGGPSCDRKSLKGSRQGHRICCAARMGEADQACISVVIRGRGGRRASRGPTSEVCETAEEDYHRTTRCSDQDRVKRQQNLTGKRSRGGVER